MPNDSVEWMSAWPMSNILASLLARISIIDVVRPGRSLPVILISICSSFELLVSIYSFRLFFGKQSYALFFRQFAHNQLVVFFGYDVAVESLHHHFLLLCGVYYAVV